MLSTVPLWAYIAFAMLILVVIGGVVASYYHDQTRPRGNGAVDHAAHTSAPDCCRLPAKLECPYCGYQSEQLVSGHPEVPTRVVCPACERAFEVRWFASVEERSLSEIAEGDA